MNTTRAIYWKFVTKYQRAQAAFLANLLRYLPVRQNKIVFNNFYGKGYGDSPKYIADEIIGQGLPYDLVWLVSDEHAYVPKGIRRTLLPTLRSIYELSTAKVIVSNVKMALPYRKKCSQYYIQTWHGSMAFKAIEKDAEDTLDQRYLRETKADSKMIDVFLSSNSVQTQEIKDCFWYDGAILECGSPRNDMLYRPSEQRDALKQMLKLKPASRILLYAPTFRDDKSTDVYNVNLEEIRRILVEKTGENWYVLTRLHPNVREKCSTNSGEYIIDVTAYPDMQELLFMADVLMTDYSTTIYDAAIMRKIILLYAPDLDKYKTERGLKALYFDLHIPICQNFPSLKDYVRQLQPEVYRENLNKFLQTVTVFDDGHASERVVEHIKQVIN